MKLIPIYIFKKHPGWLSALLILFTFIFTLLAGQPINSNSQPNSGVATMTDDGTLILDLLAFDEKTNARGDARIVISPDAPDYKDTINHLGGLKQGESKPVPPWPE